MLFLYAYLFLSRRLFFLSDWRRAASFQFHALQEMTAHRLPAPYTFYAVKSTTPQAGLKPVHALGGKRLKTSGAHFPAMNFSHERSVTWRNRSWPGLPPQLHRTSIRVHFFPQGKRYSLPPFFFWSGIYSIRYPLYGGSRAAPEESGAGRMTRFFLPRRESRNHLPYRRPSEGKDGARSD